MEYETSLRIAPDADDAAVVAAVADAFDEDAGEGIEQLVLRIHRRLFEHARDRIVAAGAGSAFKLVGVFAATSVAKNILTAELKSRFCSG
jgi:hypothetical protein